MNIGLVTFGMPPEYNRVITGTTSQNDIENILDQSGNVLTRVSISTAGELTEGERILREGDISCLVIVLSHWTRISLVVDLARRVDLPVAMYARTSGGFNGVTALTAASAGLREMGGRLANQHARFREGNESDLIKWIEAAGALASMKRSRLMCWGGSYGANMPYTRSDPDWLEAHLVSEVMTEQEIVLTDKADQIIADNSGRADLFLEWAQSNGLEIDYTPPMCTTESVRRQVALYLAARDRLAELEAENIRGVSLKCHFELSTTHWGCTGCMLPAFLPYPVGPDGRQAVVPMACEGDLNGLASLLMLHAANPEVPPLFGDFVEYNTNYVLLRNCGSSSVYWAGMSNDPSVALPRTRFVPNMHGASGAAVHYETPAVDTITMCRLFRLRGEFHVFVAKGRVLGESESSTYSDPWPHTRVDFGLDSERLFQAYPCNHSSITQGDFTTQIQWICRLARIPCHVLRTDTDLDRYLENLYAN